MAPPLGLRRELIKRRLAELGLSQSKLADQLHVNRSRPTEWFGSSMTFPKNPEHIKGLLRALDLDPVLLFDFSPRSYFALRAAVNLAAWRGSFGLFDPAFVFLDVLLTEHLNDWPPKVLNGWYAPKTWSCASALHDPAVTGRRDYFPGFVLTPSTNPQVWHFAWHPLQGIARTTWHAYGFVVKFDDRLELYHYDGSTAEAEAPHTTEVAVETWFGGGGAEFRVASLHAFQMRVQDPVPVGLPVVRFGG